ncbi:MAG: hypothetical protein ACREDM_09630 [Methylocella sp.]
METIERRAPALVAAAAGVPLTIALLEPFPLDNEFITLGFLPWS